MSHPNVTENARVPDVQGRAGADPRCWRPDFALIRGKVYVAIADQIELAIASGIFRSGDLLPTQRDVADDLGFHLNTVNAAFREAARRGLIQSRTRRGSVVAAS
ncbi:MULTISPECIES: GntR family transcriptional regulator [unclassified Paraburkholderia]|uniref:GntR family transcriptional regulator n=1 Tax=unclassified Paraburkholderia TaxID=2615204 RepID=UPI002AB1721C|nr:MULTISPECIES: GntR family transcriptional regulator [unclassified Paraburkholderia]